MPPLANQGNPLRVGDDRSIPLYKSFQVDIANAEAVANTLVNIPQLEFPVAPGVLYKFKFNFLYTAAAATTGARFTINGPAAPTILSYASWYPITATTETINYSVAYQQPAAANASSIVAGNQVFLEGFVKPSIYGTIMPQFASEVSASAITVKGGTLEVWEL